MKALLIEKQTVVLNAAQLKAITPVVKKRKSTIMTHKQYKIECQAACTAAGCPIVAVHLH